MEVKSNNKSFDKIYVGTGPILLFDAINAKCKGEKVLLIDKSNSIGGAWKLINIDGINNLENAVHYLLPNKIGYLFLHKFLKINLIKTPKKYYAQNIFNKNFLLPHNNFYGKILNLLICELKKENFSIKKLIFNLFNEQKSNSTKYPKNGSKTIIQRMVQLSKQINLKIKLETSITEINISTKNNLTKVTTDKETFLAKKVVISHGFLPVKKLIIDKKRISIKEKVFRRPSLHIVFSPDNIGVMKKLRTYSQVIFQNNPKIKYIHEITQYIPKEDKIKDKYVVVIALQHNLKNKEITHKMVKEELQKYKLIPSDKNLKNISYYWQEIILPVISTKDLEFLDLRSKGKLKTMLTEELNSGFGLYSPKWKYLKKLTKEMNLDYI